MSGRVPDPTPRVEQSVKSWAKFHGICVPEWLLQEVRAAEAEVLRLRDQINMFQTSWGLPSDAVLVGAMPNEILVDAWAGSRRRISMTCPKKFDELEAERDALRTGETWLKDRLVRMFATCIRGLADAAIITQQEYTADHVLAAVEQLASETVRLRTRCERLHKALAFTLLFREFMDEWHNADNAEVVEFRELRRAALADDQAADKERK